MKSPFIQPKIDRRTFLRQAGLVTAATALGAHGSLAADGTVPTNRPAERHFMRGMTVSCPTWGPIWGSPKMASSLEQLAAVGVRWVAIHPYASVDRSGRIEHKPAANLDFLARCVEMSNKAGIQLFWKPHLAYWGSFDWRGAITFDSPAAWRRFFDSYRAFIVDQAKFAAAHDIELFCVGLEYEATTADHSDAWLRVIEAVRAVYPGRLTYSANWDRLQRVPFWDALDLIGVQGYFPLSQAQNPTRAELHRGWDRPLADLRDLSDHHDKPILFAEIGYDLAAKAAAEPWANAPRGRGPLSTGEVEGLRRLLIEVALDRLPKESNVEGMFWWKWIPGQRGHRDFAMQHPDAMAALRSAWT